MFSAKAHRGWSNPDIHPVGLFLKADEADCADGAKSEGDDDCCPWSLGHKFSIAFKASLKEIHNGNNVSLLN